MIDVMHSMNQAEKRLDPQLWQACAGGMAQVPPPNSKVYYFPQGHEEHVNGKVDFRKFSRIPPLMLCRVSSIRYLADSESDEVYAKIRLVPLRGNECGGDDESGFLGFDKNEEREKSNSFAKTLTRSDANNGGGFSVPRYCAETIFPRLDYSAEPPVQTVLAKDVHGEIWKFRHIYRGTPRRHLLTTGWSNFVSRKKLVAGDSIVFLRAENGDLCVGIRRAKRGAGGGAEVSCGWNTGANCASSLHGGFSGLFGENVNLCVGNGKEGSGKVSAEDVIEAASLAASGQPFEVVYYPRAGPPEFVVREPAVRAAMRVRWCSGMRFKMAFETEDSSRISWFMGTICSVQVDDPLHWPNSPWRVLQVAWDEPEMLKNVKRVNPWLVELVSSMPMGHLTPPRKRPRLPQSPDFPLPTLLSNPLCCLTDSIRIQGARHAQLLDLSSSNLHLKKLQPFDYSPLPNPKYEAKKTSDAKRPMLVLFGQPILTAEQLSSSQSIETEANSVSDGNRSAVIQNFPPEGSSDGEFPRFDDHNPGLETGPCKVFVESEDVGRTLNLSMLGSYEELYQKLAAMFGIERSEMWSNVLYADGHGTSTHIGDEPFSDLIKKARRITILTDTGSVNLGN